MTGHLSRPGLASGPVLVVDYGAQYAQLIARRVRECQVYSQIVPSSMTTAEMLALRPSAVILSGGPSSCYAEGAPPAPAGLLTSGVPVLGICYGFQVMVRDLGGEVLHTGTGEYGATLLHVAHDPGVLLEGLPTTQQVWMSHGDTCAVPPPGFKVTASTAGTPVAAPGGTSEATSEALTTAPVKQASARASLASPRRAEPRLTWAEIERRKERYAAWLQQQGLEEVH